MFVARTQRWNYIQVGLSNTMHILKDLEWNAIRHKFGYTKHRKVSLTTYEFGSMVFLVRACCLDPLLFPVDPEQECKVVCDSRNTCARIPLHSRGVYHPAFGEGLFGDGIVPYL